VARSKAHRPINDKDFSLLDCFGIVGANQRFETYNVPETKRLAVLYIR
jgi:hypothetical protein